MAGDPYPKERQLARGQRRYRRKIASPKQWQAIIAAKVGPCRVCGAASMNGGGFPKVQMHHLVSRQDFGDDTADNIVPLCLTDHDLVTRRDPAACRILLATLTDSEYGYVVNAGGPGYFARAYGIDYWRET